jgi:hypothetical protein
LAKQPQSVAHLEEHAFTPFSSFYYSGNLSITLARDAGQAAIESGLGAQGISTMASGDVGSGYKFFFFMQTAAGVNKQFYLFIHLFFLSHKALFMATGGSWPTRHDRMQHDQSPSCSSLHC